MFFIFSADVHAQGSWTNITEINGEEIDRVFSIAPETNGSIWFNVALGTQSPYTHHVFKYDGTTWVDMSEYTGSGAEIIVASNGDIWFKQYKSLVKYDGVNWEYFTPDPDIVNN